MEITREDLEKSAAVACRLAEKRGRELMKQLGAELTKEFGPQKLQLVWGVASDYLIFEFASRHFEVVLDISSEQEATRRFAHFIEMIGSRFYEFGTISFEKPTHLKVVKPEGEQQ